MLVFKYKLLHNFPLYGLLRNLGQLETNYNFDTLTLVNRFNFILKHIAKLKNQNI